MIYFWAMDKTLLQLAPTTDLPEGLGMLFGSMEFRVGGLSFNVD